MRAHRIVPRALLFASVSGVALAAGAAQVRAAPVPALPWKDAVTFWFEGGGFWTTGAAVPFGSGFNIRPQGGVEVAAGFDNRFGQTPWHLSGQFRFGSAGKSSSFPLMPTSEFDETIIASDGSVKHREDHWLLDFAVGRDVGLGLGQTQVKLGVRIAEIQARTTGKGFISLGGTGGAPPDQATFLFEQKSRFVGAGPRIGLEGTVPLGGAWALDWLGGVSVLYGPRTFNGTGVPLPDAENASIAGTFGFSSGTSSITKNALIPNADAQIGLSYWITPTTKLTGSYRFDGYWGALKTLDPSGNAANVDRFFHGAMLRLSVNGPGYADAPVAAPGIFKAQPRAVMPPYNWTGLYVGGHVGGAWGSKKWTDLGDDSSDNVKYDVDGFLGGIQAGFNYQPTPWLLVGIEGDYSWANINGDGLPVGESTPGEVTKVKSKVSWISTLTGRAGYVAGPWLFFVKGGPAWARDTHSTVEFAENTVTTLENIVTRRGWTVGAGFEYAWLNNWSLKLEYDYLDFGTKTFFFDAPDEGGVNITQKLHEVKLGVNYRFNWPAANN